MGQHGRLWSLSDDRFLKANWEKMADAELGQLVGRTEDAVKRHRRTLRLSRKVSPENLQREIRAAWKAEHPEVIAKRLGVNVSTVWAWANKMSLGPSGFHSGGDTRAKNGPVTSKGYSVADLRWAVQNARTDPQAGLMLVQHAEHSIRAAE